MSKKNKTKKNKSEKAGQDTIKEDSYKTAEEASTTSEGDFFVMKGSSWVSAVICLMTRSRYAHAGVYIGDGQTVEAQPHGARICRVRAGMIFSDRSFLTTKQRKAIVDGARSKIGTPYSFLDILALGLRQFGVRPKWLTARIERSDRLICSQLVDAVYRAAGVTLFADGRLPQDVTPADLADFLLTRGWTSGDVG